MDGVCAEFLGVVFLDPESDQDWQRSPERERIKVERPALEGALAC
jgi:hypothetical protein